MKGGEAGQICGQGSLVCNLSLLVTVCMSGPNNFSLHLSFPHLRNRNDTILHPTYLMDCCTEKRHEGYNGSCKGIKLYK